MYKADLEQAVMNMNDKIENGINVTVHVRDLRKKDAILYGIMMGLSFMLSSIAVQEIRAKSIRKKNIEWLESKGLEESKKKSEQGLFLFTHKLRFIL